MRLARIAAVAWCAIATVVSVAALVIASRCDDAQERLL